MMEQESIFVGDPILTVLNPLCDFASWRLCVFFFSGNRQVDVSAYQR